MMAFTQKQIIVASSAAAAVVTVAVGVYLAIRANGAEAKADIERKADLKHRTYVNTKWGDLKLKVEADKDLKKAEIAKMAKALHEELGDYIAKATFNSETRRDQLYKHNSDKLDSMI